MARINTAFQQAIQKPLNLGFGCFRDDDHSPFVVLSEGRRKGMLMDLKNVDGAADDVLLNTGRKIIREVAESGRHYISVWDGYVTIDGQRQDAVFRHWPQTVQLS